MPSQSRDIYVTETTKFLSSDVITVRGRGDEIRVYRYFQSFIRHTAAISTTRG